jgi:hypothetical protein
MDVCLLCLRVVLSCVGKGLCVGLITRPEESYRVSNCTWSQKPRNEPMFQLGTTGKWMKEFVINKVHCERHEWLEQHETDIQPPATRCGEFPDQCLHWPLWSVSWARVVLTAAGGRRHCPSQNLTKRNPSVSDQAVGNKTLVRVPSTKLWLTWGTLPVLSSKLSLHFNNRLFHETLTQRTPSPARTPFYRTDECSSA